MKLFSVYGLPVVFLCQNPSFTRRRNKQILTFLRQTKHDTAALQTSKTSRLCRLQKICAVTHRVLVVIEMWYCFQKTGIHPYFDNSRVAFGVHCVTIVDDYYVLHTWYTHFPWKQLQLCVLISCMEPARVSKKWCIPLESDNNLFFLWKLLCSLRN